MLSVFTFNAFWGSLGTSIFRNSSSATSNTRARLSYKLSFHFLWLWFPVFRTRIYLVEHCFKSWLKLIADDNDILRCQSHLSETVNLSISHCNPAIIPHEENFIKLQSFTKYLRQTLVFTHYRNIQFFFCRRFLLVLKKTLYSREGLSTRQLFYEDLRFSWYFLISKHPKS